MAVYLDLVVLFNAVVDLLLMIGTNRLTGFQNRWPGIMAAAVLGGCYGGVCILPEFRFLGSYLWRTVFLGLMAVLGFGWNRSLWKRCAVFVLLTMTLGGVALTLGRSDGPGLVLAGGGLWLLCRMGFGDGIGRREYVTVSLSYGERQCSVIALRDSGNTLRDPITGEQVLVVSGDVAQQLTGFSREQLTRPLETLAQNPGIGLRLIPFHAVGNSCGLMLGMRFSEVRIGRELRSAVVAFAPEGVGEGEMHQALVAAGCV